MATSLPAAATVGRRTSRSAAREVVCLPRSLPANPYLDLLYDHLAAHGLSRAADGRFTIRWLLFARERAAIIHVHWPEGLYRLSRARGVATLPLASAKLLLFVLRLVAARALGYRLVWTVHQPLPHERAWNDRLAALALARAADDLLAHDHATAARAAATLRVDPSRITVIPHGSYAGAYPGRRGREATRAALGVPQRSPAFLCLGEIRGYKALDLLLAAWTKLERADATLIVAGHPKDAEAAARLRAAAARDSRIRLLLAHVPDEDVADLYAASDAAVVPRSDGGTSGSLVLAISQERPVVAADLPVTREVLGGTAAGWLFEPGSAGALAGALARAAAESGATARVTAAREAARRLAWPELAARTAAVLRGGVA